MNAISKIILTMGLCSALIAENQSLDEALFKSIGAGGQIQEVAKLIAAGANGNARNEVGDTTIIFALRHYVLTVDLLNMLLNAGADVNAQNDSGETALMWAASSHWAAADLSWRKNNLNILLAAGANINAKSVPTDRKSGFISAGRTVLDLAISSAIGGNNLPIVELLLAHEAKASDLGMHLRHATWMGDVELVRLLLNLGTNPNEKDKGVNGYTALHDMAERGFDESFFGLPLLVYYSKDKAKKIIRLLIAAGADLNARDNHGLTPYELACRRGHQKNVAKYLK